MPHGGNSVSAAGATQQVSGGLGLPQLGLTSQGGDAIALCVMDPS